MLYSMYLSMKTYSIASQSQSVSLYIESDGGLLINQGFDFIISVSSLLRILLNAGVYILS